jgi:N6-L-threonylcarbamoyladenine synthase
MILLAIETSCDETSVALLKRVRGKQVKFEVLSHKILSQIDIHKEYGGVFPALAKREHARSITQLIAQSLHSADLLVERARVAPLSLTVRKKLETLLSREEEMLRALTVLFEGIQKPKIDGIAVTAGPGLEPALWVGINCALALHQVWDIPLYPINHMEGHIVASLLSKKDSVYEIPEFKYPGLGLLISGGHTELVRMPKPLTYQIIGETKDDAVGECFDKSARMLGLPYPGGPEISKLATYARDNRILPDESHKLPRPMLHSKDLFFSFSGLKTAVLTKVKKIGDISEEVKMKLALEIENAITDVLVAKTKTALYETRAKTLIVGGGVSANTHIRNQLRDLAKQENVELFIPERHLSTDNALMIGAVAMLHIAHDIRPKVKLKAQGNWKISDKYTI